MTARLRPLAAALMTASVLAMSAIPAQAEEDLVGGDEYLKSCASCHGVGGRGNGPVAEFLKPEVPDLTKIKAQNNGVFPIHRIIQVIDGRAAVRAHGDRPMPVWGTRFSVQAAAPYKGEDFLAAEQIARGRILELVSYLQAIQQPGGEPLLTPNRPQTAMDQPEDDSD